MEKLEIELFKKIEITSTEKEDVRKMCKEYPEGWRALKKIIINEIQKEAETVCDLIGTLDKDRIESLCLIEALKTLLDFLNKIEKN